MSEFSSQVGTIYISEADNVDEQRWEVWYEDLCILGVGNSEIEALNDAVGHVADIAHLVNMAIISTAVSAVAGGSNE